VPRADTYHGDSSGTPVEHRIPSTRTHDLIPPGAACMPCSLTSRPFARSAPPWVETYRNLPSKKSSQITGERDWANNTAFGRNGTRQDRLPGHGRR
jgi:hypothetical protein